MRRPVRRGGNRRLLVFFFWCSVCIFCTCGESSAQFGEGEIPAEMLQPRIARPHGEAQRNLERLDLLIEQAAWDEVCTIADELLASPAEGWVAIGPDAYAGVHEAVHRRLAALPAEGLAVYRRRIDPVAEQWLEQGVDERDEQLLRRVVDEAFCSSAGDDALWALGEIALERGDYQAARTAWRRINPATADEGVLIYPDASIAVAEIRARLALVSIREGDFDRAMREIEVIRTRHPDAAGRLAGGEGNLVARLHALIEEARIWPNPAAPADWPALFANPRRTSITELSLPADAQFSQVWSTDINSPTAEASLVPQPMTFPIVAHGMAMFSDASGLRAVSLCSSTSVAEARTLFAAEASPPILGSTLTAERRKAFAVIYGEPSRPGAASDSRLVGVDLERDGALMFEQRPEQPDTIFVGTPVVAGSRVVVCELAQQQGMHTSIACYDWGRSQLLWRQSVGWVFDAAPLNGSQPGRPELASQEGVLYVNTNIGMVAALRLRDGQPQWLHTYRRTLRNEIRESVTAIVRPPNPCVVVGSTVFAAPSDGSEVFAFDAASGTRIWSAPLPAPDADLLAVDGDHVILTGERLWRLDANTGKLDQRWGEELRGGGGQGAVAGPFIFWPTAGDILLIDRATGRETGRSVDLPAAGGAHLVIGSRANREVYLIAAGPSQLGCYRQVESDGEGLRDD